MTFLYGVLASLVAPLAMSFGLFIWHNHWHGSAFSLNIIKCSLGSFLFLIAAFSYRITTYSNYKHNFELMVIFYLFLSSLLGICIGDNLWLSANKIIGSRRLIIIDTLKPFLSACFGFIFLGEIITLYNMFGMVLTMLGVLMVSLEMQENSNKEDKKLTSISTNDEQNDNNGKNEKIVSLEIEDGSDRIIEEHDKREIDKKRSMKMGYLYGFLNVVFDIYGTILTKAYAENFTSWEIGFIRFGFASIVLVLSSSFSFCCLVRIKEGTKVSKKNYLKYIGISKEIQRYDFLLVVVGIILVTFLTPALTNYALFEINIGLLMTLTSLGPLYSLPIEYFWKKEKITCKMIFCSLLSVIGLFFLFFEF